MQSPKEVLPSPAIFGDPSDPFFPSATAAAYICRQPATLKLSRHTGKLAGVEAPEYRKIGGRCFYKKSTLDDWIEQFQPQHNTSQNTCGGGAS